MEKRNSRLEFVSVLLFLVLMVTLITNGFVNRIAAQGTEPDVYQQIEPIGDVLDKIRREYVREPDMNALVQGALQGMMSSLDRHSSFVTEDEFKAMREDTQGEFEGIGVTIRKDEQGRIVVFMPIPNSPAAKAGLLPFDIITAIDGESTEGMELSDAADRIRGKRGTTVTLTILRLPPEDQKDKEPEVKEVVVTREKVPLESIKEGRLLPGGIAYIRISDFKDITAREIAARLKKFKEEGMTGLILDLRWNPGGLLTASKEVCELFLPRNTLVTYTKGRPRPDGQPNPEDMRLYTESAPVLPPDLPLVLLVNEQTASSAEIVTGALQYYKRAIVVGEKTFGKGSVQTIIPLERPAGTALRLTTALYYTPADVTIDHQGILPDVEVPMTEQQERALGLQMYKSFERDPSKMNEQNHGTVTGAEPGPDVVEDIQLQRAVEILRESKVWDELVQKYHRDVRETQVAATENTANEKHPAAGKQRMKKSAPPNQAPTPAPTDQTPSPAP